METVKVEKSAIQQRNSGIDLLRIVAAFYVIVLHILNQGGLLIASQHTYQGYICAGLNSWTYCAVNIFGIISGYVGYSDTEKPIRFSVLLHLWLEVVFYDVVLTLLTMLWCPGVVTVSDLISMLFPVIEDHHWYFTAYTALFLLIPLLNRGIRQSSSQSLLCLLGVIVFVISPIETLSGHLINSRDGYSLIWLLILYLIGAILKKCQIGRRIHPAVAGCCVIGLSLVSFLVSMKGSFVVIFNTSIGDWLTEKYVFPGHLLSAIFHVILFSRLKPGTLAKKLIAFAAPGAFAVYIINTQPYVWSCYMDGHFTSWAVSSPLGVLVRVVLCALLFVSVSVIIDFFRRKLFRLCTPRLPNRYPAQ